MLFRLKLTLSRQLALFALFLILSSISAAWSSYSPPMRAAPLYGVLGLALGAVSALLNLFPAFLAPAAIKSLRPFGFENAFRPLASLNIFTAAGFCLTAAAGEELLLRGFVFGPLAGNHLLPALLLNFALTFAAYWNGKRCLCFALLKSIEATLFAAAFLWFESFFMLLIGRAAAEAAAIAAAKRRFKERRGFKTPGAGMR